jgi:hypothetical protein
MALFNWDAVQHEATDDPWEFTAAGKTWRVPHIKDLKVGQQMSADSGHLAEVMRDVAEVQGKNGEWRKAGVLAQRMILNAHADQVGVLVAAWLAHAGMVPGESPASSH